MKKYIYKYFLIGERHPITNKKLAKDTLVKLEISSDTKMVWVIKGHDSFRGPIRFNKAGWSLSLRNAWLTVNRAFDKKIVEHRNAINKLNSRSNRLSATEEEE